tara:strand:+ start:389 stop:538 length:150 start_codon:yes stop_codon:yes gene_type:complete
MIEEMNIGAENIVENKIYLLIMIDDQRLTNAAGTREKVIEEVGLTEEKN